jgi:hypothetical protein
MSLLSTMSCTTRIRRFNLKGLRAPTSLNLVASEYIRCFRETTNKCYNLTIGEKDLVDLAFAVLASHLKERMEGQEFTDMNQVLQRAMFHENHAREHQSRN